MNAIMCVGPQTFVLFPIPNPSLGKMLCFLPHTLISRTETRNYVGQFSVHILESDKMLGYWLSFLLIDLSGPNFVGGERYEFGQLRGHFYCSNSMIMQISARPDIRSACSFANTDVAPIVFRH